MGTNYYARKLANACPTCFLRRAAETLLESEFGTAILQDAAELVAKIETGQITLGSAIVTLASDVVSTARTLGPVVASMALAKAQGALTAATTATANTAATTTPPSEETC